MDNSFVTKIVMVFFLLFGSIGLFIYLCAVIKYIYQTIKKEEREKIWPPFLNDTKRLVSEGSKSNIFGVIFSSLFFCSIWIALAYWIEYLLKAN